jgi:hypothetical protein
MSPFIKDGDIITVGPRGNDKLRRGDVVAFVNAENRGLTVHRLSRISGRTLELRGDNLTHAEGCATDDVLGKVIRVERNGVVADGGLGAARILIARLNQCGHLPALTRAAAKLLRLVKVSLRDG